MRLVSFKSGASGVFFSMLQMRFPFSTGFLVWSFRFQPLPRLNNRRRLVDPTVMKPVRDINAGAEHLNLHKAPEQHLRVGDVRAAA